MEATIILHISGGAPPYTVYHDQGLVTTKWKTDPSIVFQARACNALVHTITVESADGQTARNSTGYRCPGVIELGVIELDKIEPGTVGSGVSAADAVPLVVG